MVEDGALRRPARAERAEHMSYTVDHTRCAAARRSAPCSTTLWFMARMRDSRIIQTLRGDLRIVKTDEIMLKL